MCSDLEKLHLNKVHYYYIIYFLYFTVWSDKDGKLHCPNCHRAFNKERHFKTHKCLANSLYIDISKREVRLDSGKELGCSNRWNVHSSEVHTVTQFCRQFLLVPMRQQWKGEDQKKLKWMKHWDAFWFLQMSRGIFDLFKNKIDYLSSTTFATWSQKIGRQSGQGVPQPNTQELLLHTAKVLGLILAQPVLVSVIYSG